MKWIIRSVVLGLVLILFVAKGLDESQTLEVTYHRIGQEKGKGSGLRIAQISDLHVVGFDEVEEKVIQVINREDPDVVVLTGDILPHVDKAEALEIFLDRLGKRSKKFAILGNWEYFWHHDDSQFLRKLYTKHQVTLLVNEAIMVEYKAGEQLLLVGLDDALMGKANWKKAMVQHADWQGPTLILAHNPILAESLPVTEPSLSDSVILSGHTHGGQIKLFGWTMKPTGLKDKTCMVGWCRMGGMGMYVSRGIGTSIIPIRIGSQPELAFFEWVFHAS